MAHLRDHLPTSPASGASADGPAPRRPAATSRAARAAFAAVALAVLAASCSSLKSLFPAAKKEQAAPVEALPPAPPPPAFGSLRLDLAAVKAAGPGQTGPFPIASFSAELAGPEGASIRRDSLAGDLLEEPSLAAGNWSVKLTAMDELGAPVAEGFALASVRGGAAVQPTVSLQPLRDDRNLLVELSWPAGVLRSPGATISLGRYVDGKLEMSETGSLTVLAPTRGRFARRVEPGHYFLIATLTDAGVARAWLQDNVQAISGEIASVSRSFASADIAGRPAAPDGFAAQARSDSSIYLSWRDASADERGFVIMRRRASESAWAKVAELGPNTSFYLDKGLLASTRYSYAIVAFNDFGESGIVAADQATPTWDPGTAVLHRPAEGEVLIETKPAFSWSRIERAREYELQYSLSADFRSGVGSSGRLESSEFRAVEMLRKDAVYYWRVRGINADGIPGEWSKASNFSVLLKAAIELRAESGPEPRRDGDLPAFLQGQGIAASAMASGKGLSYSWFLNGAPLSGDSSGVSIRRFFPPGIYTLTVIVKSDPRSESFATGSARFAVLSDVLVPGLEPPAGGTLWYVPGGAKVIRWEAGEAARYHVQILDPGNFNEVVEESENASSGYAIRAELPDGKPYAYRLRAADADGSWSSWTQGRSFTARAMPAPAAEYPAEGAVVYDERPRLRWAAVGGAAEYEVRLAVTTSGETVAAAKVAAAQSAAAQGAAAEYVPERALAPGPYSLEIRSLTREGEAGEWSKPRLFAVDRLPAPDPSGPGPRVTALRPAFSWKALPGVQKYQVEVSRVLDETSVVLTGEASGPEFKPVRDLDYGLYSWRVRALSDSGSAGPFSAPREFEIAVPAPSMPAPSRSARISDRYPILAWGEVPGASSYELQIARSDEAYTGAVRSASARYSPSSPLAYGAWKWRVRALAPNGAAGPYGDEGVVEIFVPEARPRSPAADSRTADRRPVLAWAEVPGVSGYELQLEKAGAAFEDRRTVAVAGTEYRPDAPLEYGRYSWRVRGRPAGGASSAYGAALSFEVVAPIVPTVEVPAGGFVPGTKTGDEDERPQRQVSLSRFAIGVTEVTREQYRAVTGSDPSAFQKSPKNPVEQVSWYDAIRFCNALSEREGLAKCYAFAPSGEVVWDAKADGYRLPTEAEWEYAALGAEKSKGTVYSGGKDPMTVAWFAKNSPKETQPAGGKLANEIGLFDMSGNVWEWCWDWYAPYGAEAASDPRGPAAGQQKATRGGSWESEERSLRAANRNFKDPTEKDPRTGFRVARSLR